MKKHKLHISTILIAERLFSKMIEKTGHKLDYELNRNLFFLRDVLKKHDAEKQQLIESFKTKANECVLGENEKFVKFFSEKTKLKEGEKKGLKFDEKTAQELNEAVKKLSEQSYECYFLPINEVLLKKALKSGKFEGLDISFIFELQSQIK